MMDLWKLGLNFAVEKVPANVGQVSVNHISWRAGEEKVVTPLELMNCEELVEKDEKIHNNRKQIF